MAKRRHSVAALFALTVALSACSQLLAPARSDTGARQDERERIVSMIESGELTGRNRDGELVLPADLAGASSRGVVTVQDDPLMVFFTTWTGISPDPYCGYEYAATPEALETDPGGGGYGEAELVKESWYWICGS